MNALGSLGSLLAFAGIVVYLQRVQEGYDWRAQFISELALGAQGAWMLGAFISVALACCFGAQSLRNAAEWRLPCPFPRVMRALFFIAAAAFLGAGLVTLQDHVNLHLLFVALAFFALMLSIWIVLRYSTHLAFRIGSAIAFGLVAFALLLASLQIIEPGTSQRLAAAGLLGWMAFADIVLIGSASRI
jgi:hypothetical protein